MIAPVGMLLRKTSLPLRCTTAPSSRSTRKLRLAKAAALETGKVRRNQVVMKRLVEGPPLTTVASSPSPNPSWAGPLAQVLSLKPRMRQALGRDAPLSRYFHTAPAATSNAFTVMRFVAETVVAPPSSVAVTTRE